MLPPMKVRFLAALALAVLSVSARADPATQPPRAPVVVELYTSQGCDDCFRANRLIGEWKRDPGLIALTFPVGYWDYLGWSDTFAQVDFSNRQRDFSRTLHTRAPFTPQLVIDGVTQVSASDWDEARGALTEVQATPAAEGAPNVTLTRTPTALHINIEGGVMRAPADIWLLSVDPGPLAVAILYGENANRVMIHYNLVRRIRNVGTWRGAPMSFDATHCLPQCAVLVQNQNGGRILAAAMTRHSQ